MNEKKTEQVQIQLSSIDRTLFDAEKVTYQKKILSLDLEDNPIIIRQGPSNDGKLIWNMLVFFFVHILFRTMYNGILCPKLFQPTVRKKCSSD